MLSPQMMPAAGGPTGGRPKKNGRAEKAWPLAQKLEGPARTAGITWKPRDSYSPGGRMSIISGHNGPAPEPAAGKAQTEARPRRPIIGLTVLRP